MTDQLLHLSFYSFFDLNDLPFWKKFIYDQCFQLNLTGTILIAPEGINGAVSGLKESIEIFSQFLQKNLPISPRALKCAPVFEHSFKRLLVKIKSEIIPIGDSQIAPHHLTGNRISPKELKSWIDKKKTFLLLDARNRYEFEVGSFENAIHLEMDSSREFFQKAITKLSSEKEETIVTFCTGGIRCEKASAVLIKLGFKNIYQLDGGIVKYFEENGAAYFRGNCFVFDWRLAIDGSLNPLERSDDPKIIYGRHRVKEKSSS